MPGELRPLGLGLWLLGATAAGGVLCGCEATDQAAPGAKYAGPGVTHDPDCSHHASYENSENTDEKQLKLLKGIGELVTLTLSNTDATDHGLKYLTATLPHLREIHMTGCPGITDNGIEFLKGAQSLVELTLIGTKVTEQGLEHLQELRLRKLRMDGLGDAGLESLKKCQHLESLELIHARVSDAGVRSLAEFPQLQFLLLLDCEISEPVFERLKQALPNCKILRENPDGQS